MKLKKINDWLDSCEDPTAPLWKQLAFGTLSCALIFGVTYIILQFMIIFC